jgi:hypothetical protein
MINLITKADLDNYKYVADSTKNSQSFPQFISEAQLFDVKVWLGDALLNELIVQASTLPQTFTADNLILLNGGTYVYQGDTYIFQGLRAAIIYYAFARFTNRTSFNYTAAGLVIKDSDLSTPATDKQIQRLETESRLMADAIKCEVETFLNRNHTLYPLWDNEGCRCGSNCNDFRINVIGE